MREDLLHYVWKTQKFRKENLRTTSGELLEILHTGHYNTSSGPDFFNARVRLSGQEWAGNLEIHVKSSDWYIHNHEKDPNYDNVILHVVWEDDTPVFRKDGTLIPVLELQDYLSEEFLLSYKNLVRNQRHEFINCEKEAATVSDIIWEDWQQRLYVERLENKSKIIQQLLRESKNDWEAVLFVMLAKNFGLNKNGPAFMSIAKHIDFNVVKKVSNDVLQLESLLMGFSGFLTSDTIFDQYYLQLQKEFEFLRKKFQLNNYVGVKPVFFGLRPPNFPTIRLSQLAQLHSKSTHLFSKLMETNSIEQFYDFLEVNASPYWNTHYTFGKSGKERIKSTSKDFLNLLLINTIVPLKFCYHQYLGENKTEEILKLISNLPAENNNLVNNFSAIGLESKTAFQSQAKIQLHSNYCSKNKCLECHVGGTLLGRKT